MRDLVLGICILASMLLGFFFAKEDLEQWMHWPIYISLLALAALVITPMKWQSPTSNSTQHQFEFVTKWLDKIPSPIKRAFSIFLAIIFGGILAALATKLGVPIPTVE